MTTIPAWADANWTSRVSEPFRSDRAFWISLAASADALLSLAVAIAAAVVLVATGERGWSFVPFVVPAALAVRAAVLSHSSSRHSQQAFADRRAWRDAERSAVAASFGSVLRRRRMPTR
jgi:hypothetical protein